MSLRANLLQHTRPRSVWSLDADRSADFTLSLRPSPARAQEELSRYRTATSQRDSAFRAILSLSNEYHLACRLHHKTTMLRHWTFDQQTTTQSCGARSEHTGFPTPDDIYARQCQLFGRNVQHNSDARADATDNVRSRVLGLGGKLSTLHRAEDQHMAPYLTCLDVPMYLASSSAAQRSDPYHRFLMAVSIINPICASLMDCLLRLRPPRLRTS